MDVLGNLKTFLAVASGGGFSEAARKLHVVPSVVAKRIAQLEKTMGSRLFERSTRSVVLTEAGEQLQARAAVLMADFDELVSTVQRDDSKLEGHIRVMAPTTLTMVYLGQVINAFLEKHERITMELALVDQSTNPQERGFDMAISGRTASYDGVLDVPLCAVQTMLFASPGYVAAHGEPAHPRELADHRCLVFAPTGVNWQFESSRGAISVEVRPRLLADDNRTLLDAAVRGMGVVALPLYVARDALAAGQLLPLLGKFPLQETWFRAYLPRRSHKLARVQALVDWLATHLEGFMAEEAAA
ncbi:MAG: LysR family transcriptional regulator [Polaromonas sp.]|uniref:LysR family transcriptional regulator n=1 Tax=Polaromonas sp. TaxID=1869339 RepID=UPI0025F7FFE1|nr:LysR family transcriptional regulator [Polaromonas sp.]MBI2726105.1 LysR family transcriptional regulator [Polaromonas sp.]